MTLTVAMAPLLISGRVLGFVLFAPVWSWKVLPPWFRGILALTLTVSISPGVPAPILANWGAFVLAWLGQVVIGLMMGLVLYATLASLSIVGTLVTEMLGVGLAANVLQGVIASNAGFTTLLTLIALFAFIHGGGLLLSIMALHYSLHTIPLTAGLPPLTWRFVASLGTTALATALLIAAPFVIALFILLIAIGVVSRAFVQMNAYFLAMPATSLVFLVILWWTLPNLSLIISHLWKSDWVWLNQFLVQRGT